MSVLLYPSGVTENYDPKDLVFTDQEIFHIFKDFEYVRSARLVEIPNTWCVWAQNKKIDENNFNKIGSDILKENIFCELLFIKIILNLKRIYLIFLIE